MKKILLSLCLLVLAATAVNAQYFGARIGLNATNAKVDFDNAEIDTDGETNLMIGAFADLPLFGNIVSIQPEINYLNRGYEINAALGSIASYKETLSFVDLGAIVKLNFGRDAPLGFYVGAGPYLSYAVSGKRTDVLGERDVDFDTDRIKRSGVQFTGLGGVTFGSSLKFFAEVRYNGTLGNTSDLDNAEIKRNFVGISGGIMVPL